MTRRRIFLKNSKIHRLLYRPWGPGSPGQPLSPFIPFKPDNYWWVGFANPVFFFNIKMMYATFYTYTFGCRRINRQIYINRYAKLVYINSDCQGLELSTHVFIRTSIHAHMFSSFFSIPIHLTFFIFFLFFYKNKKIFF